MRDYVCEFIFWKVIYYVRILNTNFIILSKDFGTLLPIECCKNLKEHIYFLSFKEVRKTSPCPMISWICQIVSARTIFACISISVSINLLHSFISCITLSGSFILEMILLAIFCARNIDSLSAYMKSHIAMSEEYCAFLIVSIDSWFAIISHFLSTHWVFFSSLFILCW